nr:thioesterase family protein [Marinithermus hydrothermalis]
MDAYPVVTPIQVRFRDLDSLGHVNNAVYLTYLELARIQYLDRLKLDTLRPSIVVARIEIDYLRPILLGEEVAVGVRVTSIGNKSFRMEYGIAAGQELAARATSVQVWLEAGRPAPVPTAVREAIQRLERLPVQGR